MRATVCFLVLLAACDRVYGLTGRAEPTDADPTDASDLDRGLVAWYPMDTISDRLEDASGNGFDGLCEQSRCPVAADTGMVNGALAFDGTMVVGVNPDPRLETRNGFTISGWYRLRSGSLDAFQCPFNKVGSTNDNPWQLCFSAALQLRFITTAGILAGPIVEYDRYYHIVLWWDGAEQQIYVDGLDVAALASTIEFTDGIV